MRAVLLAPLSLPDWNPAFLGISGRTEAEVGAEYLITVRPGLAGTFTYTAITDSRFGFSWKMSGFNEDAIWDLTQDGSGTQVTHSNTPDCWLVFCDLPSVMLPQCD